MTPTDKAIQILNFAQYGLLDGPTTRQQTAQNIVAEIIQDISHGVGKNDWSQFRHPSSDTIEFWQKVDAELVSNTGIADMFYRK